MPVRAVKPPLEVTTLIKEVDLARNGARSEPLFQKLKSLFSSRETTVLSFLRTGSAAKASQEGNAKQVQETSFRHDKMRYNASKNLPDPPVCFSFIYFLLQTAQ